ncbi:type II toxin-antitoxin system VapC family toxin [Gaiella sp.]|uniref:type II toxin-antitoxin system VapC family toxin n=1 Tax=Gaiella sp. TaxID=2663207 RepID=UPI002E3581A5|nr:type II toxin-antitoxin system VapC family toxin [Gaiella sp.]HEX5583249.1 type II toxin-antitoxin system VapC family toxin [Gaiella sp.]
MNVLLDTHVLLWALGNVPMRADARSLIENTRNTVCVSAASAWEIGIKKALGKLGAPDDLENQIRDARFIPLQVTIAHGLAVGELPRLHGDPFDRLLVAQAKLENLTLVTRDERLGEYGVPILAA